MEAPRPAAEAAPTLPTPPVVRRRKRWFLRLLGWLLLLAVAAFFAVPLLLGLGFVRHRVSHGLGQALGAEVQIDGLAFSWTSGFRLDGLRIANPQGFDPSHPAVTLRQLTGRIAFSHLARGRFGIEGKASGLRLQVDQDRDGNVNLQAFGGNRPPTAAPTPTPAGAGRSVAFHADPDLQDLLQRLRLDFDLDDTVIEIRRDGRQLETLTAVTARLGKTFGSERLHCEFGADTGRGDGTGTPGRLAMRTEVDVEALAVNVDLAASNLDLGRYQPLAALLLPAGQLTAMGGVFGGDLKLQAQARGSNQRIHLDGHLQLQAPHFAGALLRGMDVRGARWTATPKLDLELAEAKPPQLAAEQFAVDLGFLQVHGLAADLVRQLLGDQPGLGFGFELDSDQLAAFGGDLPPSLRAVGGMVRGTVALPLQQQLPEPKALLRQLVAEAQLQCRQVGGPGFTFTDVDGKAVVRDGKLSLSTQPSTRLNAGAVQLTLHSDLQDLDRVPFDLGFAWQGGQVDGEAAAVLRYLVPLLAGIDGQAAAFRGRLDLALRLRGPSLRRAGENWLQLLDQWSGDGQLSLRDGTVVPAAALQPLLGFLGQDGRLQLDRLDGKFTIAQGAVASNLMKWVSKGRDYGLAGTVRLDGEVDCRLDLTDVLQQHKDGQKVLAVLGKQRLFAGLRGPLDAPGLQLPDLGPLLRDAAAAALQQEAQKALQQQGGELLQKGLDQLFGKPSKPGQSPLPKPGRK